MAERDVKRVSLYFNMENPIEKRMWEYLENSRSKSNTIKNLLEEKINISLDLTRQEVSVDIKNNESQPEVSCLDKIELDESGMQGF